MKTHSLLRLLLLPVLVLAGAPGIVHGADTKAPAKKAPAGKADAKAKADNATKETAAAEKRPPLKLAVDSKPINRDAADRVSYAPIVKRTAASVVFVHSSKTVRGEDLSPFMNDPFLRRFFDVPGTPGGPGVGNGRDGGNGNNNSKGGATPRRRAPSRAPDQVQQGLGSGVVITPDGYILTNNHVVEGADEVKITIGESNKRHTAKVIGRDAFTDIAVLKIEATGLSPAVFGDSDQVQVGDVVLAIGNPFGVGQSVSRGIVSALSRGVGIGQIEDFIQTDAAINPGNSGGALLDTEGRVVGINTAILSRSGGFNGVGFAIPINLVRNVAEQIVNKGRVERGMLGVVPQELDEDLAAHLGVDAGVVVSDIVPDSPAEKAGLKPLDVITRINTTAIRDRRHLLAMIGQLSPETNVTVEYLRDGKMQKLTTKLMPRTEEAAPADDPTATKEEGVLNGVTVGDLSPQVRSQFSLPGTLREGAIITEIEPDSPSARQGLREGDVIVALDRQPVKDAATAVKLSEEIPGPRVLVSVWRNGGRAHMVIDESK